MTQGLQSYSHVNEFTTKTDNFGRVGFVFNAGSKECTVKVKMETAGKSNTIIIRITGPGFYWHGWIICG